MIVKNQFFVDAPIATVWSAIIDPNVVAPCIPGCENVELVNPAEYKVKMQTKIGPITARFNLDVRITEETPPGKLTAFVKGEEGSRASIVKANVMLLLRDGQHDSKTEVEFIADVSVVGRLAKFGLGIMKKKSQELGDEFARNFGATVQTLPI